jgi:hypothetical protein
MFTPPQNPSLGFPETPQGKFIRQAIANVIRNPLYGSTVYHYRAKVAVGADYNSLGQPGYLAPAPGVYDSGVEFEANPDNPLKGIFCRQKQNPFQDKGGQYYQGEAQLYLLSDPGEVFILSANRPKRQDKFVIAGGIYYATAPVFPCQMGDTVAAFQVFLSRERYPVRTDGHS